MPRLIAMFHAVTIALLLPWACGAAAAASEALPQSAGHHAGSEGEAQRSTHAAAPERNQRTPRNAVYNFIMLSREGNWKAAGAMLERPESGWPDGAEPERLARALKTVLDTRLWLDLDGIPDEASGGEELVDGGVSLGEVVADGAAVDIRLENDTGEWAISSETVQAIPQVAREVGAWWVSALPPFMVDVRFAEIELWQWIGLAGIAIVGVLAGMLAARVIGRGAAAGAERGFGALAVTLGAVAAPIGFILSFVAMQIAEDSLVLSVPARENLSLGTRAATAFVVAWAVVRWIRAMSGILEKKLEARGVAEAVGIVRIGRVIATALVYILGVSAALQIFGLDLSAVIAGLGIGTAAIALASQQTLGNLFGGASVLADRVLRPGDTVSMGGTIATVERIGIRSTQLRTPDRTLLVVANGDLAQSRIEKLSARDGFRLSAVLGLRYETTPAQMRAIVAALRAQLSADPLVDAASVRVHFLNFGASSLDVDIKAVIQTTDAAIYRETTERLNLAFMDIVEAHGSSFAFPSTTVYMARDAAPRG
ncbi:MAG: mechanosensitive ion channel family protein [Phycisphaerales bacterium]